MTALIYDEVIRINTLILKIRQGIATATEMQDFLNLIQKSGQSNWLELENYVQTAGYSNINEFQKHLNDKNTQEFFDGLVKIGLAILIAYGLAKLFEKK